VNYQAAASALFGRKVEIRGIVHDIVEFVAKEGKLKDGSSVPYVGLSGDVVIHPRTVKELFTKGEAAGIKLLVEAVAAEPVAETPVTEATSEAAPATKKVFKKQLCTDIFEEVVAASGTRQDCIKRFQAEGGLSLNGANTYYQNLRSSKWK